MSLNPWLIRRLFSLLAQGRTGDRLTILQFHKAPKHFDPLVPNELMLDRFETILDFVAEQMNAMSLSEALSALGKHKLPKYAVALTFDDGYVEWNDFVAPKLIRRGMPATFYVSTGQLDGPPLWHERIVSVVRMASGGGLIMPDGIEGHGEINTLDDRVRLVLYLQEKLKYLSLIDRDRAIEFLESQVGGPIDSPNPFTAGHVRQLHSMGFEIGAHTVRHPILTKSAESEARYEIGASKETLDSIIRGEVSSFAYPNGVIDRDFSQRDVILARACGYRTAVMTGGGIVHKGTDHLLLPRFSPWGPGKGRMALQMARNLRTGDQPS